MDSNENGGIPALDGNVPEPTEPIQSLTSRAYQIEMFEQSLNQNTIVCMGTGSGKTQIARLRIEAELTKKAARLVWFLAPSQVLAHQQHVVMTSQLPTYSFRLITGADNVEFWSSKEVWSAALLNQDGVVSTPQVLLDALKHDYLPLTMISLLVFDEAHHCMGNGAYNKIMRLMYDPLKAANDVALPCVLGLTASPVIRDNLALLAQLEGNLHSVCRSPTVNFDQYKTFTHVPELVWLPYKAATGSRSSLIPSLETLVREYDLKNDPTIIKLSKRSSEKDRQKLEKYRQKAATPILEDIAELLNKSVHMEGSLGSWATDRYIMACIDKLLLSAQRQQDYMLPIDHNEHAFLAALLEPLREQYSRLPQLPPTPTTISPKITTLIEYLRQAFRDGMACVVFVERRSTAYALCDVLSHTDCLSSYRCFTFVGSTSRLHRSLADLADHRPQNEAFADFRAGNQNVCIATQVLEEGIDVQACNLVICFDPPPTIKSYIQRRGRARHPDAKLVMMQSEAVPVAKHQKWLELEEEMKRLYSEQDRERQDLLAREDGLDDGDTEQPLRHGRAIVETSDARQKLEYFCATMKRDGEDAPSPLYILDRSDPDTVACSVILPHDLPLELRTVRCSKPRLTESAAKRDAAFQAYKLLYQAGFLNEHLMPIHAEARHRKGRIGQDIETRDAKVEVPRSSELWDHTRSLLASDGGLYAHQIVVPHLPSMLLLLPSRLPQQLCSDIYTVSEGVLSACITPILDPCHIPKDLAIATTKFLYRFVLGRRLAGIERSEYTLPYYIVPELGLDSLEDWFRSSQTSSALLDFEFDPLIDEYLIKRNSEITPYYYKVSQNNQPMVAGGMIEAEKLHRAINFTTAPVSEVSKPTGKQLPVEQCTVSSLAVGYARFMAYLPTIMRPVELALRAQQARVGPLRRIKLTNAAVLSAAFTASEAGDPSYQRLEYLGDTVLKFMATINVFCHNPKLNEGSLTVSVTKVVNNARLHRSTLDLGLEAFLTTEPFSTHSWTLASRPPKANRQLSTKVLADLIEALLGVAYLEGEPDDFANVVQSLQLFIPELSWNTPVVDIATIELASMPPELNIERLDDVQDLLGYSFVQPILLVEALNHSSTDKTLRSYDRLEFLGDAVIDLIVKRHFYHSPHNFSEEYMTTAGHALVNKEIFAFLTTTMQHEFTESKITVNPRSKGAEIHDMRKVRHLHDYMTRLPSQQLAERRTQLMKHYGEVHVRISEALEGGKLWPWTDLLHLDSPKWASDIFESIIGAVFIDSGASLPACEAVLQKLGLMRIVERAAKGGDVEFRQARARLLLRYPMSVKFRSERYRDSTTTTDGAWLWRCEARVRREVRGRSEGASCKAEAEERAAEDALAAVPEEGSGAVPGGGTTRKRMRDDSEADGDMDMDMEEVDQAVTESAGVESGDGDVSREEEESEEEGEGDDDSDLDEDGGMQL